MLGVTVDGYLLDTSILSALLDPTHQHHDSAVEFEARVPDGAPRYVSVIAIGELVFGKTLAEGHTQKPLPRLAAVVEAALKYLPLDVTKHTASEYGWIKAQLALKYLRNPLGKGRHRWVENWVDVATGQALQVDENDLWMHAQARERGLVLVTTDGRQRRIVSVTNASWTLIGNSPTTKEV